MIDHVYFLLDERQNEIKIGGSYNLLERLYQQQKKHFDRLKLLGIREGDHDEERRIQRMFRHLWTRPILRLDTSEWFQNVPELTEWIAANTQQWDGSDTWPYHQGTPTAGAHGSREWMAWLERFLTREGVPFGTLLERALAAYAREIRFEEPAPQRWPTTDWPDSIPDRRPDGEQAPQ